MLKTPTTCACEAFITSTHGECPPRDADLVFYENPAILFDRFETWSALVVPQGSPRKLVLEETHGVYNAGLVAFHRRDTAKEILDW